MTQDEIYAIHHQYLLPGGTRDLRDLMRLVDEHAAKTGEPLLGVIEAKLIFLEGCRDSEMEDGDAARWVCEDITDAIQAHEEQMGGLEPVAEIHDGQLRWHSRGPDAPPILGTHPLYLVPPVVPAPQFNAMAPEQERLAIAFCNEIAGPLGKPGSPPDPVRLLEMAQALYEAEVNAR